MSTIQVCDAICGAGKTSASITLMREEVNDKFIFITQYLSETERIKRACPERRFYLPESDTTKRMTKMNNFYELLQRGENIATTHALFTSFSDRERELIKLNGYRLILDEVVDLFRWSNIKSEDLTILEDANIISLTPEGIQINNPDFIYRYKGLLSEELKNLSVGNLTKYKEGYFFWSIPPDLFKCFKTVHVLTYLFEAQELRCFFQLHDIPYRLIGTKKFGNEYRFCPIEEMNRARELRNKIHILENEKLNSIGDDKNALSYSWYVNAGKTPGKPKLMQMKRNITNTCKNIWQTKASDVMWTTFKEHREALENKGYKTSFVAFNKRASNEFATKHHLVYTINNNPRPWELTFFSQNNITLNRDMYGLSNLIQWVFRSAIRRDEEVWLYIPSIRMRTLFKKWMDNLAEGKDLDPVAYK